MRKEHVSLATF